MKRKVLFPYMETLVGGSYISSSIIAGHLKSSSDFAPCVALPGYGANAGVFRRAGLKPHYYGLSPGHIDLIHSSSGYIGKLRASPAYLAACLKAVRFLEAMRPDIVHINDDSTILTWGPAARLRGIPVIWHVRQEKANKLLDSIRLKMADYLIFIARSTRNRFGNKPLPPNWVIYNGVDLELYQPPADRPEEKKKLGLSGKKVTVGFIGNFTPNKRPDWFVQAGIDILKAGAGAEFVMAGQDFTGGRYEKELRRMVSMEGFEDSFFFLGYRNDIPQIMKSLDVLLLTSVLEPFGRVIIEAMACEVAVLATMAGGVPEIIDNGKTGIMVPPHDYHLFQKAALRLITDRNQRQELSGAARGSVMKRFSAGKMVRDVISVYSDIIDKK